MPLQRLLLAILAGLAAVLLAGCGGKFDPISQIEDLAERPLWQKAGAVALTAVVSEDLACIAAGLLASEEVLSFGWAFLAALLGTYAGDLPIYLVGRIGGLSLLRRRPFRWFLKEEHVLQAEGLFHSHAIKIIFSSRLLPGSRLPIYAAAGVLGYPFWKFATALSLAAGLSTLALVWGSMRLGEIVFDWLAVYESYVVPVSLALVFVIWLIVKTVEVLATRRGRLVFLARSRRLLGGTRRRPRNG